MSARDGRNVARRGAHVAQFPATLDPGEFEHDRDIDCRALTARKKNVVKKPGVHTQCQGKTLAEQKLEKGRT